MDNVWLENEQDYKMKPYRVLATNDQVGMIEMVEKSDTLSDIHNDHGSKTMGALFNRESIWRYLKTYNTDA